MILLRDLEEGTTSRYVLIELQGELQINEEASTDGIKIGDLKTTNNIDYTMDIMGKQRLIGKRVKLPNPYVLLLQDLKNTTTDNDNSSTNEIFLDRRLITEKISFSSRPMAIL